MSTLSLVFQSIKIGRVTVPNRIVRTAHGTWISQKHINDDLIAYHVARAKGGAGLSYIEFTTVHPSCYSLGPYSWDDSFIKSAEQLMAAIRPYGMRMFQQLAHGGSIYPASEGPAWSASSIPNPIDGTVPIAMSQGQIDEIVDAFAAAARRAEHSGIDGVEMHAGHSYLIHQFISPLTNRREDRYGGNLENRMRFLREILRASREATSDGFPIGIRLSDSYSPGGIDADECAQIAGLLETEGLIDFINGSQGGYHSYNPAPVTIPAMDRPVGSMLPSSSKVVSGAKKIPRLLTASRVRTLEEAEQFLREGLGDLIGINRAFIADPDLVRKTRENRADQIRPCIACNQGCIGGLSSPAATIGCAINVAVGFEKTLAEDLITEVSAAKKVLVVGGGPAGLEAARVAALRGHTVTLAEAAPTLGGLVNVAKLAPEMNIFGDITEWLEREVYRLGVEVRTGTYLEADDVYAAKPDAVIVSTGSQPRLDGMQAAAPWQKVTGVELPHVISSIDLLTNVSRHLGRSALVFDDVGHYEAVAAAEFLIKKGVSVTFVTRCGTFAPIVDSWMRAAPALQRLYKGDFKLMTLMQLIEIRADECVVRPFQSVREGIVPAETVVLVMPRSPLSVLYTELEGKIPLLSLVGDARSPRDLQVAIREGHLAARAID